MLVGGSKPCCLRRRAVLPFGLSAQYGSNYPNHDGCCPIAAELLVSYRRMEALFEALDPFDQFEGSVAHSTGHDGFRIGRLVVTMGWRRQTLSRR